MKCFQALPPIFAAILCAGCGEKDEVSVSETRPVASNDFAPRLDATPDERFSNARRCPFKAETPQDWKVLPATEFRLMNYGFGPSGQGEVWVSTSNGSVLDNANRWLRQFGKPPIDEAALKALPTVPILGTTGVLLKTEGDYTPGMGQPPKPGYGLAGVIADYGGEILTIKMVAPAAEVRFGVPALEKLVASLRKAE